jgi:hypothetical protein
MATMMQALPSPEAGWKRFDDDETQIFYGGVGWTIGSASAYWGAARHQCANTSTTGTISFDFIGSNLRLLSSIYSSYSNLLEITIDGVAETFSEYTNGTINIALVYQKLNLPWGRHKVSIRKINKGAYTVDFLLDAIDIDQSGRLLHQYEVFTVPEMTIGDKIRCHYYAPNSNTVGVFSDLGAETSAFIPLLNSSTANGDLYLIYVGNDSVGRKLLIADRNAQTTISWDTLNTAGIASGSGVNVNIGSLKFNMRLLTGGVTAGDTRNDWDEYIVSSTLGGKVVPGDKQVWNWAPGSWVSTTPSGSTGNRAVRGNTAVITWGNGQSGALVVNTYYNFRPIFTLEVSAPIFAGSLDRATVHNENVSLNGTVTDVTVGQAMYRIALNNNQIYPASGYTALANAPLGINYTIGNNLLNVGSNTVVLYVTNGTAESSYAFNVSLSDASPTITASMNGMKLDMNVTDSEGDTVQFNVKLNGSQVYPIDPLQTFTALTSPTVYYNRAFMSNEVIVNQTNTVLITARDRFGVSSTATLTFTGGYSELLFADEQGVLYSTDLGTILKYLDIGVMTAGQISGTYPVRLINRTGYSVNNVILSKNNKTLTAGVTLEISQTESPFIPETTITHGGIMNYNDEFTFYLRIVSQLSSQPGQGEFDIYVTGDPY